MVRVNANVICGLKSPLNNISVGKAEQISMWIQTDDFGHRCYIDVSSSSNANWTIIAIIPKIIEPPLFPAQIVKSRWKLARINRRTAEEQDSSEDLKAHTWRKVKWLHCCGLIFTYINVETRRRMLAGCMVGWLASNNMALAAVLWSLPKYSTEQPPNSWSWGLRKKPVPSASWPLTAPPPCMSPHRHPLPQLSDQMATVWQQDFAFVLLVSSQPVRQSVFVRFGLVLALVLVLFHLHICQCQARAIYPVFHLDISVYIL